MCYFSGLTKWNDHGKHQSSGSSNHAHKYEWREIPRSGKRSILQLSWENMRYIEVSWEVWVRAGQRDDRMFQVERTLCAKALGKSQCSLIKISR